MGPPMIAPIIKGTAIIGIIKPIFLKQFLFEF